MQEALTFGLFCFVSLFAVVEPLGVIPIFIGMTAGQTPRQQRSTARRACLVALVTLLVFAFTGKLIFRLFGISVEALKVVGGIIFFMIGHEMLQAKLSRTAYDEPGRPEAESEPDADIAITPLGIPMISGPGAIANVIVFWNLADSTSKVFALLGAITAVIAVTLVMLLGARRIARFLGDAGNKVLLRMMGLITMVIAVEFFFSGLTPIVQRMLQPPQ